MILILKEAAGLIPAPYIKDAIGVALAVIDACEVSVLLLFMSITIRALIRQ
jgi:hypothetical protein